MKKYSNEEIAKIYSVKNRKLPDELIKQANSVNIMDYIEKKGLMVQKSSKGTFQLAEHDSLKITPSENVFNWYSRDEGGYGAVGFARVYFDMDFRSAVRDVMENADELIKTVDYSKYKKVEEPYTYDRNHMGDNTSKAEEYLVEQRGINPTLVEKLIDKGIIRQTDKYENVAFMWHKNGEIIGHEERGTGKKRFMKIASDVPENRGFSVTFGKPENLFVFESSIDALSYASIYQPINSRFISMNGLKENTMYQAMKDIYDDTGKLPENVVLCVDNDKAGRRFVSEKSASVQIGNQETTTYSSLPPRFEKNKITNSNMDIESFLEILEHDNNTNITINNTGIKLYRNVKDEYVLNYNDLDYTLDGKAHSKKKIKDAMSEIKFDISYIETTKDWNEVLKYIKENNIKELNRPLVRTSTQDIDINPVKNKDEEIER